MQQILLHQLLKIAGGNLLSQPIQHLDAVKVQKGLSGIVEPTVHTLQSQDQSLGVTSVISFPEPELGGVYPRLQGVPVDAVLYLLLQHLANRLHENFLVLRVGALRHNGEEGLLGPVVVRTQNVLADALVQKRLAQGRAGRIQKGVIQHLKGLIQFLIQRGSHHKTAGEIGPVGIVLLHGQRILLFQPDRLLKGGLQRDLRIHLHGVIGAEILPVQIVQPLLHVHIPVEIDIGVGGMIVGAVEIQELLVGQFRDILGISAGLVSVGRVREERVEHRPVQNALRGGEGPLHLVVHHAV